MFYICHYLNTYHHTIRQTCLICLHLSVLCIFNLHNSQHTLQYKIKLELIKKMQKYISLINRLKLKY